MKAIGQCGTKRVMIKPELQVAHAQPVLKSMATKAQMTEAHANKHAFTKVECLVLPRCNSSFLEKLPVTDPHLSL
jgi:hypothetical protein